MGLKEPPEKTWVTANFDIAIRSRNEPQARTWRPTRGSLSLPGALDLPDAKLTYRSLGQLRPDRSNLVLVPTPYNAWVQDQTWLMGTVFDPARWCVVVVGQWGNGRSSSPSNSALGLGSQGWPVDHRDNVRAQRRLLEEVFAVESPALICGWSMGAQQAYHWGVLEPERSWLPAYRRCACRTTPPTPICCRRAFWRRDWMASSANWIPAPAVSATTKPIPPRARTGERCPAAWKRPWLHSRPMAACGRPGGKGSARPTTPWPRAATGWRCPEPLFWSWLESSGLRFSAQAVGSAEQGRKGRTAWAGLYDTGGSTSGRQCLHRGDDPAPNRSQTERHPTQKPPC